MTWTINDVITKARDLLQDSDTPYRATDEKLVSTLNVALNEAKRVRPDLFLPNIYDYTPSMFTADDLAADPAVELPIDPMYFQPMVDYVVSYTSMEDDEYAVNSRAAQLMAKYYAALTGAGGSR